MLVNDFKAKWLKERETIGYIKLEYGHLIDLFVHDLIELEKEFKKMEEMINQYKEGEE